MSRFLILLFLFSAIASGAEYEMCLDREFLDRQVLRAPGVTELREGSVVVAAIIDIEGKVISSEILSQEGDHRWGKEAIKAIEGSLFKPTNKICRFETKYTAIFEIPRK